MGAAARKVPAAPFGMGHRRKNLRYDPGERPHATWTTPVCQAMDPQPAPVGVVREDGGGPLFQRQEQLRHCLMLRNLGEQTETLAIEREVAHLLTAGG